MVAEDADGWDKGWSRLRDDPLTEYLQNEVRTDFLLMGESLNDGIVASAMPSPIPPFDMLCEEVLSLSCLTPAPDTIRMVDGAVEASICPCRRGTPIADAGDSVCEEMVTGSSCTTDLADLSRGNLADAFLFKEPKDDEEAWRNRKLSDDPTDLMVPTRDLRVLLLAVIRSHAGQYSEDRGESYGSLE